jgi:hypothetical protein
MAYRGMLMISKKTAQFDEMLVPQTAGSDCVDVGGDTQSDRGISYECTSSSSVVLYARACKY